MHRHAIWQRPDFIIPVAKGFSPIPQRAMAGALDYILFRVWLYNSPDAGITRVANDCQHMLC